MPSNFLLQELNKIKKLIPKLEPYWRREARELPDDLKKELYQIKAIPPLTSGGLESVNSILETLFLAQLNIEDLDKETTAVPTLKQPIPPKKPEAPTTTAPTNLSVIPKINLPAPSVKPQQIPPVSQKPPAFPQVKSKPTPPSPPRPPSATTSQMSAEGVAGEASPPKSSDTLDFGPYYKK